MALTPPPDPEEGEPILPWARAINRLLKQIIPRESKDIWPRTGTAGTSYELRRQPRGGDATAPRRHPFQILPDPAGDPAAPKVSVHLDSWLMGSREADDKITITGLGEAFAIAVDEYIWIEVAVAEGEASGDASIEHGSEPWPTYPFPYDDSEDQTAAYFLIGYTQAHEDNGAAVAGNPIDFPERLRIGHGDGETMQIVQCLTTNLIVTAECEAGQIVVGLAPWSAVPAP